MGSGRATPLPIVALGGRVGPSRRGIRGCPARKRPDVHCGFSAQDGQREEGRAGNSWTVTPATHIARVAKLALLTYPSTTTA